MYSVVLYSISIIAVLLSWKASKDKTRKALRITAKSFAKIVPAMIGIIGIIGLLLTCQFWPPLAPLTLEKMAVG